MSPSDLIAGRYDLQDTIGSGAMGDVHRAIDTRTGEIVAIKQLRDEAVARSPEMLERFIREGQALRDLDHPNIVNLLDVFEEDGNHYLVTEYIEGGDLGDLISQNPDGLPVDRVLAIGLDLADALSRAHRSRIIHRDVKPENILIARDGSLRLTDFGIAQFTDAARLTNSDAVVGTFSYLPPESFLGETVDERSDIWSFGIVLYEMLTGEKPFGGENPGRLVYQILNDALPDIVDQRADISDDIIDLLFRMLTKKKDERIPSARLVGVEIEAIIRGEASQIMEYTEPQPRKDQKPATDEFEIVRSHNLQRQTTAFVGRVIEKGELIRLITDSEHPLVTVLGPGGMGKTRLSIEVGQSVLEHFRNGVFFVKLAKLTDSDNIPVAIGEAIGHSFTQNPTPLEQITQLLANKHMLLILDNFEHLADGASLVADLLASAPELSILATSRITLNLNSETVFPLAPMDFPDWEVPDDALQYSAVQLFMQSAKRTRVDFELQPEELALVTRIVRLVEGIPLGILLAAAWIDTLSLEEIAEEIAESMDFLESQMQDLPERQRSMRAVFAYSWNLLSEGEREVLAKMAIFRGGGDRQAVQAVTGSSLRMLISLVNKSLLNREVTSGRFQIHELIRQYAVEYLPDLPDADAVWETYSDTFIQMLVDRIPDLKGRNQLQAMDQIDIDFENIRVAWERSVRHQRYDDLMSAITAVELFCNMRSRYRDALQLLNPLWEQLDADPSAHTSLWVRVFAIRETFLRFGQMRPEVIPIVNQFLDAARENNNRESEGLLLLLRALIQGDGNLYADMLVSAKAAGQTFEELDDRYRQAFCRFVRGYAHLLRGETEEGIAHTETALELQRSINDYFGMGLSLNNLGSIFYEKGDKERGQAYYREAYKTHRKMGYRQGVAGTGAALVEILIEQGDLDMARSIGEEAVEITQEIGDIYTLAFSLTQMVLLDLTLEDYPEAHNKLQRISQLDHREPQIHFLNARYSILYGLTQNDGTGMREQMMTACQWVFDRVRKAWLMHLLGVVLAVEGEAQRSVQLLAMWYTSPYSPAVDKEPLPVLRRLLENLQRDLGNKSFESNWKQGQTLDIESEFEKEFSECMDE